MENALALDLRPDSPLPLHQQVYEQIRLAILSGRVRSRQKLPASRQLAQSLGISRTTVTQSYDQLISEGYLETRRGSGTFVCAQVPDALIYTAVEPVAEPATEPTAAVPNPIQTHEGKRLSGRQSGGYSPVTTPLSLNPFQPADFQHKSSPNQTPKTGFSQAGLSPNQTSQLKTHEIALSTYGQRLFKTATLPEPTNPDELSFRYWRPDLALFPRKQWQRLVNRHCSKTDSWMTYSSEPAGYGPLRSAIATYITQSRAVHCTAQQILITQGTQQALGLIAQVLLDEGDAIALETPGYLSARKVFSAQGALTFPIPVDDEGLDVAQLAALSAQTTPIKLAYVTPSHQFPTGALMSLPRRLALLKWAQQTDGLIVEDDYDSAFRYSGRPIPALQG
ncbi:MAG: PLP-dependent aminotransferase family protein, partial [Cyanobacteria bacterium J06576_12]